VTAINRYDEYGAPASWSALPGACTQTALSSNGPDRISRPIRDAAGRVTEVRSAVGTTLEAPEVRTTYSDNGETLTVKDAEDNLTSYAYDGHDRLRRTIYPLATQGAGASNANDYEELTYDAGGNVVARRNRAGETAAYTIDAMGRITSKDLPNPEPDVTYAYDLLGRMTGASQIGHNLTFTYDALGRQLTQAGPMGTIASLWDVAGRRTRITHPGGYYVDQDYLVTGEVAAIRENGATSGLGVIAAFTYDTRGRRASLVRGNGVVTNYNYDPASRLATLAHDLAGSSFDLSLGFTYNPAGQILSNTRSNDLYSHTLTPVGTITSTPNGLNQLTVHAGAAATHDARGNLTAEGGRTFSYSSENLLTGFTGHGRIMSWTYDPLMRVYGMTTSNANPRTYMFDGDNMLVQNMNGNYLICYVYGPGEDELLYSRNANGTRLWMQTDERGSIVGTSDTAGNSATPVTYDEYGQPSTGAGNHGSPAPSSSASPASTTTAPASTTPASAASSRRTRSAMATA
jgi:YD repeat-containing protein